MAAMRAVVSDPRGQDGLRMEENYPAPKPGPNEVLVEVHAVGLNPVDFKMPDVPVLGYLRRGKPVCHDFAGKVLAIGERCTGLDFQVGDSVYGETKSGTCCDRIAVGPNYVAKMPGQASFEEAAALPLAVVTTYQAMQAGGVKQGSRVMVIGASGGTGTLGVQVAKAMGASHVTAVTSSGNFDFVKSLGADDVMDYRQYGSDLMAGLSAGTDHQDLSYDMVYDTVTSLDPADTNYTGQADRLLKPARDSRYIAINGTPWDWGTTLLGLSFGRRKMLIYNDSKTSAVLPIVSQWIDEGKVRVIIDSTVPFTEQGVRDAFQRLKSRRAKGKVVCKVK